jgi:hypothetical protein
LEGVASAITVARTVGDSKLCMPSALGKSRAASLHHRLTSLFINAIFPMIGPQAVPLCIVRETELSKRTVEYSAPR